MADYQPKHRAETEDDRLMTAWHDHRERTKQRDQERYAPFEKHYCQEFSDVLDGFVIHAPTCKYYQDLAVSGSGCVQLTYMNYWPPGLAGARR